jgi:hypothetical protein
MDMKGFFGRHGAKLAVLGLAFGLVLAGCSGTSGTSFTGTVSKGPIANAEVTVYELNSDGTRGDQLGATVTGSDGSYTVSVDSAAGAVEVVVSGGSYEDEATGQTVELGEQEQLRSMVTEVNQGDEVAVTALTEIAAEHANENAEAGLNTAIEQAKQQVASQFGLGPNFDISEVQPDDLTQQGPASGQSADYGAVLAGISQVAQEQGASASDVPELVQQMARDFEDGSFDRKNASGETLQKVSGIAPDAAKNGLQTAMENFMKSERNKSDQSMSDLSLSF